MFLNLGPEFGETIKMRCQKRLVTEQEIVVLVVSLREKNENITFKMNTTEANIKIIKNINSY